MFASSTASLRKQELKHQEAIYEIACGEEDLAEDLQLVQKTYADSLLSLKILTPAEVNEHRLLWSSSRFHHVLLV